MNTKGLLSGVYTCNVQIFDNQTFTKSMQSLEAPVLPFICEIIAVFLCEFVVESANYQQIWDARY